MRIPAYDVILAAFALGGGQPQPVPIEPHEVLSLPTITDVRISPDGVNLVYTVQIRDPIANVISRTFWLRSVNGERVDSLPIGREASNVLWRPDGLTVTYLAPADDSTMQIWEYAGEGGARQVTSHPWSILSFEWSADNRRLAFTSSRPVEYSADANRIGVVVDRLHFWIRGLLADGDIDHDGVHYARPPARNELWVLDVEYGSARRVTKDLSVGAFAWSPDATRLAFTGRDRSGRLPPDWLPYDLLLYTVETDRVDTLEIGTGGDYLINTVSYGTPFWSPDGNRVGYFRRDRRDPWESSPQLGIYSLAEHRTTFFISSDSMETYQPRAIWPHPDTILLENTYRAGRRLWRVAIRESTVHPVVESDDWFSDHSLSKDGRIMAFVRERIDTPPDVYVSDPGMRAPRRVTNLGNLWHGRSRLNVERFTWTSRDGAQVEGWLYLPEGRPPFPTILFVHGGPTWVYPNRHEPYMPYWPYAFSVFAARGFAVLIPNYRGTGSYGRAFRETSALDAEPVDDIMTGIDALVRRGVADPSRLGIAGHSHGCSLGSLIAVRYRRFLAGACAEGTANWTTQYAVNSGWTNSEIVDHYWGAGRSPYQAPEAYRRLSAVYGFEGLQMPFLFEVGELGAVLNGVEFAMAALRSGVPHELVIYRNTGHNVTDPLAMLEVMRRNLEWFEFWLLGREYDTDGNRGQYDRWKTLREDMRRGTG